MPLPGAYYFLDRFNDSNGTTLSSHTPDLGLSWNGPNVEIQDSKVIVSGGGFTEGASAAGETAAADSERCETGYLVEILSSVPNAGFRCGNPDLLRYTFSWIPLLASGPPRGRIAITANGGGDLVSADIPAITAGVHLLKMIGEGDTLTCYVGNLGIRLTGISPAFRVYNQISFSMFNSFAVQLVYGRDGIEPDFDLIFLSDFGAVGGFSGSSGGGGGSGGVPNPGSSNPPNIPCVPGETLVINNGTAVSIAPTDPCLWTGLIWWVLACGEVLTDPDYAVEAEVFFNTLTDSFMSVGVIARLNESSGGHYFATLWRSEFVIGKKLSAGSEDSILATVPMTLTAGRWYTVRLELEGNLLRGYVNDELKITTTDPNSSFLEPGCAGVRLSRGNPATDIRIDNFRVWLHVKRPLITEEPFLRDLLFIHRDDGMNNHEILVGDVLQASSIEELLFPKIVHLNEGAIFGDIAQQVKLIREICMISDVQLAVGVHITFPEVLRALEFFKFDMSIPVVEVLTFLDSARIIHGVSETLTLGEALSLNIFAHRLETSRMGDTVSIMKTQQVGIGPTPDVVFQVRLRIYRSI